MVSETFLVAGLQGYRENNLWGWNFTTDELINFENDLFAVTALKLNGQFLITGDHIGLVKVFDTSVSFTKAVLEGNYHDFGGKVTSLEVIEKAQSNGVIVVAGHEHGNISLIKKDMITK